MYSRWLFFTLALALAVPARVWADDVQADPSDYKTKFATLSAGDRLLLAGGDYTEGLRIDGVHGQAGSAIVIEGPASGTPARFLGRSCCNTIDIADSSYVTIRNIEFDGQDLAAIDAIKAGGNADQYSHHITVENCTIRRHDGGGAHQLTVGISTKIVSWDWVVRDNVIDGAGTGMYFGNSDGTRAFIGGIIEGNLFLSTLGYNMQIKHQLNRQQSDVPSVPTEPRITIIRHNVFIKSDNASPSGARPNLLVSGKPDTGPGSSDHYEIYGNLFYHNHDGEPLFQASGRVHVHDNIFVDGLYAAIMLAKHHEKEVIDAIIYNNTIYATDRGIGVGMVPTGQALVAGNAIFSPTPFSGSTINRTDNITDSVANASNYVNNPTTTLGEMDFFPVAGSALHSTTIAIDFNSINSDIEYDRDFNGTTKDFTFRGAYHGEGANTGWALSDELKPHEAGPTQGSDNDAAVADSGTPDGAQAITDADIDDANNDAGLSAAGAGGWITAGNAATAGTGEGAAGTGAPSDQSPDGGGCGCRIGNNETTSAGGSTLASALALLSVLLSRRRRP